MKAVYLKKSLALFAVLIIVLIVVNCSSEDGSDGGTTSSNIVITGSIGAFGEVNVLAHSASQSIEVSGDNLSANVAISSTANFEISLDDSSFSNQLTISKDVANAGNQTLFVRFSPSASALGPVSGELSLQSNSATTRTISLTGVGLSTAPIININVSSFNFQDTPIAQQSAASALFVDGNNLSAAINLSVSEGFEISLDGTSFSDVQQIASGTVNNQTTVFVRFAPTELGDAMGVLSLESEGAETAEVALSGTGIPIVHNYLTFDKERLAFGGGFNQSATQTFSLHDDVSNIETIKMYVKLTCPTGGCDEWDVYANVKIKDDASGELYELGRYITPYWNDNSQLDRGFEFDVTDFKSLLSGSAELRIRTECWNARGYEVTVDFDFIEGTPDYPYYAISRVIAYDDWSSSGVPYGTVHSMDLDKTISIPANAESTHLRTVISGWGQASPAIGGRTCAEWCFRTHDVRINGVNTFQHDMGPLDCASNPVNNQEPGNWQPDRAGWCPGMVVPYRIDDFATNMAGNTFGFEYTYEGGWTNDGQNGNAFYATSTFVVVKSNTPITKPVVTD
ncbi:peptide-N-glycosidase F-related protein [uncultured Psychroserpens sp.]|uniref:peptide-N-glycosidase F-related protein n=1 Tax=uncultured Psychroserpens sp. TaxID=255436 RepID=UPI0026390B29|nr:peptide-N-glycosidase F-related protein [uncultured Psychroserpens sp.]